MNFQVPLVITFLAEMALGAAPVISTSSTGTFAENIAGGTVVISGITADQAATWTLAGTDAALFDISPTTTAAAADAVSVATKTTTSVDYETKSSYAITITATNSANEAGTKAVTLTVTNVNEAPSFSCFPLVVLATGATSSTTVATALASDPDSGNTVTHSLTHTEFEIVASTGVITIKSGTTLSTSGALYLLQVSAADNQSPALSASTNIFVCVGTCEGGYYTVPNGSATLSATLITILLAMVSNFG